MVKVPYEIDKDRFKYNDSYRRKKLLMCKQKQRKYIDSYNRKEKKWLMCTL